MKQPILNPKQEISDILNRYHAEPASINNVLKQMRTATGFSQKELAEKFDFFLRDAGQYIQKNNAREGRVKISGDFINNMEEGKYLNEHNIRLLENFYADQGYLKEEDRGRFISAFLREHPDKKEVVKDRSHLSIEFERRRLINGDGWKTTYELIDNWAKTEQGPEILFKMLKNAPQSYTRNSDFPRRVRKKSVSRENYDEGEIFYLAKKSQKRPEDFLHLIVHMLEKAKKNVEEKNVPGLNYGSRISEYEIKYIWKRINQEKSYSDMLQENPELAQRIAKVLINEKELDKAITQIRGGRSR